MAYGDVDTTLRGRYLSEAAEMLCRVKEDVNIKRVMGKGGVSEVGDTQVLPFSRLEAVKAFLPDSILENWLQMPTKGFVLEITHQLQDMKCLEW